MINVDFGFNLFLSFICTFAILIFYGVRKVRPELSRDEDIFFVTIGLIYCGIIAAHGWRLDPILLFSQALIITMLLFASWENVRLRGILETLKKNKD